MAAYKYTLGPEALIRDLYEGDYYFFKVGDKKKLGQLEKFWGDGGAPGSRIRGRAISEGTFVYKLVGEDKPRRVEKDNHDPAWIYYARQKIPGHLYGPEGAPVRKNIVGYHGEEKAVELLTPPTQPTPWGKTEEEYASEMESYKPFRTFAGQAAMNRRGPLLKFHRNTMAKNKANYMKAQAERAAPGGGGGASEGGKRRSHRRHRTKRRKTRRSRN